MNYQTLWDTPQGREILRRKNPAMYETMLNNYGMPKSTPARSIEKPKAKPQAAAKPPARTFNDDLKRANEFLRALAPTLRY